MATERYNPREAEPKWQKAWAEAKLFETDNDDPRPKYYVLEMFPYPSGRIHIGHTRNYTMGDVVARHKRALGYNVLHPMGWDAFGMPAENAAMQNKVHPGKWTYDNIDTMREQLKLMGLSIDWSREFATCDVDYYHRQQMLFLDFLEKDLVYRKQSKVNWDPVDMTVLANEQVIDGRGWRSGAPVEQRELTQWFFRITAYARICSIRSTPSTELAGKGPRHAEELDRPVGRPADPPSRKDSAPTARPSWKSSRPVRTRSSAPPSWRSPPIIRWPGKAAAANPELAAFCDECRRAGTSVAALERRRRKVSTPAFASFIRSIRPGRCRSMSPTSS
jgi:leucyl-tRNA synthetase